MCSQEAINKIDNGEAIVMDKKHLQWGAIITVVIFIVTQTFLFATWKGAIDKDIEKLKETGSAVAVENSHKLDNVTHNLKRLMEKSNLRWDNLNNGK